MNRRDRITLVFLLVGLLLVVNPLYLGPAVPDTVTTYERHSFDPSGPGNVEALLSIASNGTEIHRADTGTLLREAVRNGTETLTAAEKDEIADIPADGIHYVVYEENPTGDRSFYRIDGDTGGNTAHNLTVRSVSRREVAAGIAVPLANASASVQRVVREGEAEMTAEIETALVATGDGYVWFEVEESRDYDGPLALLPPLFAAVGVSLIVLRIYYSRRRGPGTSSGDRSLFR